MNIGPEQTMLRPFFFIATVPLGARGRGFRMSNVRMMNLWR